MKFGPWQEKGIFFVEMIRCQCQPQEQAYTMGIAELRRSVESPGGAANRTVPILERNDRQRNQSMRLSGVETEAWLY